jgi:hypothetical protein
VPTRFPEFRTAVEYGEVSLSGATKKKDRQRG